MNQDDPWSGIFLNRRQEWGQESDTYLKGLLDAHTPALQQGTDAFKGRCMHCNYTREPCDVASAAATALVRSDAFEKANKQKLVAAANGLSAYHIAMRHTGRAFNCENIGCGLMRNSMADIVGPFEWNGDDIRPMEPEKEADDPIRR